ncbi:30S ribosomal protein S8e [Candidatus Pacearchaeota archaeon]|nr:30S ribosomal protein S8e [Candidatus Pacearchaeota archaeon]
MRMGRKITGGKYHKLRKRKLFENRNKENFTVLGETKTKALRVKGGNSKTILLRSNKANVLTKAGKMQRADIVNVVETPQNRFLARQNRLLKGAIIDTSLGKARITNRPTQEGQVNASLI